MEPKDRRFAEIAARLQMLTQEQLAACAKHMQMRRGIGVGEAAVELGFLSSEQADRVRGHEARLLERQREHTSKIAGAVALEERARKADPRSASAELGERGTRPQRVQKTDPRAALGPPPGADQPPARSRRSLQPTQKMPEPPVAARKQPRTWEAQARREDGQVLVPRSPGERPVSENFQETPTAKVSKPSLAAVSEQQLNEAKEKARRPSATHTRPFSQVVPESAQRPAAERPSTQKVPQTPAPVQDGGWFDLADSQTATMAFPAVQSQPLPSAAPARQPSRALASEPFDQAQRPRESQDLSLGRKRAASVAPPNSYLGRALALALRHGASDLHAHSGAPLLIRVDGRLRPLSGNDPLSASAAEKVIAEVMGDAQKAQLAAKGEVDFACEMTGLGRMRVNVYRQQRGLDAVFRLVPKDPATLEQLGLPARLNRLTEYRTGMVLCTGPAGCGKSTTLAALLSTLVANRADHILTIEDPVEFVYPPGKALINQRQVRDHTSSTARALRAALREDPDIIVITELRDRETISLAISAAETGHLVLGTLHTGSAAQTIHRIVSSFAADEQEQMRVMLADSLRAVISQRLVPRATGTGRVPALEILMVNIAVSNLIRDDKAHQLPSVMQTGKAAGMMTLDDSLDELLRAGTISVESARRYAVKKERFP